MSVDTRTVALVRIAAATARGDESVLRDRMIAAQAAGVPSEWVDELLLQSFLNVGYPLALVAFGVWRGLAGPGGADSEPIEHADWEKWKERGVVACQEVYGRTYHKLLVNLRRLHPAIEALVVVDAYGKVLGRPALDPKQRELCTLAAIAMIGASKQLHAHFRGALNTGSTQAEIDEVLSVIEPDLGEERALQARRLWSDVRVRNL